MGSKTEAENYLVQLYEELENCDPGSKNYILTEKRIRQLENALIRQEHKTIIKFEIAIVVVSSVALILGLLFFLYKP